MGHAVYLLCNLLNRHIDLTNPKLYNKRAFVECLLPFSSF